VTGWVCRGDSWDWRALLLVLTNQDFVP
jgi:hypothetical protein